MIEDKIGTQIGFKANTNYNFGMNFKPSLALNGNKNKFTGISKKRFNSATSTGSTAVTNGDSNTNTVTSGFTGTEDDKLNNVSNILTSNIDANEWKKEFLRVEKNLVIPEVPEIIENSESTDTYTNIQGGGTQNLKYIKKINAYNSYLKGLTPFYESITNIQENVDKDLNKIKKLESSLSNRGCIKEFADKLRVTNSAISSYKNEIQGYEDNINKMEKDLKTTEKQIEKISAIKEDLRQSTEIFNKKNMRNNLDKLKSELNQLEGEEALFSNFVFSSYSTNINNKNEYIFSTKNQNIEEKVEEAQFDEEIE